jgi:hypothetical protein
MSMPSRSAGKASTWVHGVLRIRAERHGADQVDRQDYLDAPLGGGRHHLGYVVDAVGLQQRVAHLVALGLQERVRHAAADQDLVGPAEQVVDDRELVGRLGPAQHDHVRAGRVPRELLQHRDLVPHQLAGRVREQGRDVVDAGVLTVQRPESVAHVHIGQRGQPGGELSPGRVVLAGLGGLEANVLHQRHIAVQETGRDIPGGLARDVSRQRNRLAQQLAQAGRDRDQGRTACGPRRVILPLRPAQVGDDQDPAASFRDIRDCREAGPDAPVVGDRRAIHRHVQVRPEQDDLRGYRQLVQAPHDPADRLAPTRAVRSASRFE